MATDVTNVPEEESPPLYRHPLNLPAGRYRAEWVDTRTGAVAQTLDLDHGGGRALVGSPEYSEDIALRIVARP